MRLEELETPFVAIDLDRVERNLFRPYVKTHKLPAIVGDRGGEGVGTWPVVARGKVR